MPLLETKGAASAQGFGGAGAGASGPVTYIEDVFSTYLYTGNGSTQTITNGIDLAGKGGVVWVKNRGAVANNLIVGADFNGLVTNSAAGLTGSGFNSFNSSGFSMNTAAATQNASSNTYASWTFRKQPKFFDIVTYTGNGANRTIAHSLGSVPGCIIIKRTDTTGAWAVYHRSLANTEYLVLNTTAAKATGATYWNSTTPTSTVFSLGTATDVNANTGTYVAYLFAHNAGGFGLSGTDNVISCGLFTTDSSFGNATVNLGYEAQWLLIKRVDAVSEWYLVDVMRGWVNATGNNDYTLSPNTSGAEALDGIGHPTATGFDIRGITASSTWIYIAIRRGPMKVPTSGTSVFNPLARSGNSTTTTITSPGFAPDSVWVKSRSDAYGWYDWDKLRGVAAGRLQFNTTGAEPGSSFDIFNAFTNTGYTLGPDTASGQVNTTGSTYINYALARAPSFFDVVCYTGTGANTTQTHNLGVVPELIIVKLRDASGAWDTYSAALSNTEYLVVNTTAAKATGATRWNSTTPTSTVFSLGTSTTTNASAGTYVAYLFATCAGVSKVGSYTGTGALQTINCGFTGGARFVLIKRTDSTGDWYVYDSARGISSGNDPYLLLNSTAAEVTGTDYVDTDSTGFKVTAAAPAGLNANGGSFVFLAIA